MKVDLTDGKQVWRVLLNEDGCFGMKEEETGRRYYGDKMILTVRRYDIDGREFRKFRNAATLWSSDGVIEQEIEWFSVGRRGMAYVDTLAEAIDMQNKHDDRRAARSSKTERTINIESDERRAKLKAIIRKHKGYKRALKKEIESVTRVGKSFEIVFTSESDRLPLTIKM